MHGVHKSTEVLGTSLLCSTTVGCNACASTGTLYVVAAVCVLVTKSKDCMLSSYHLLPAQVQAIVLTMLNTRVNDTTVAVVAVVI
jgi:hypothetical protein